MIDPSYIYQIADKAYETLEQPTDLNDYREALREILNIANEALQ